MSVNLGISPILIVVAIELTACSSSVQRSCDVGKSECPDGYFCSTQNGFGCGGAGKCQLIPEKCPYKFSFVCGCDGNSYSNICTAGRDGMTARKNGPCDEGEGGRDGSEDV